MNTTAPTITTGQIALVREALAEAIEAHADAVWAGEEAAGSADALEILGITEDEAVARFGEEIGHLVAHVSVDTDCEDVELCCVTFDCPGERGTVGTVTVLVEGFTRRNCTVFTTDGRCFAEVAEGEFAPLDGLSDGLAWVR